MNNNHENTMKKLEEYRKEPGFTVPDGYYDDLYEKMMSRIAVEHHKTNNHKKFFRFSMVGSAAAAVVAFVVTISFLNQNPSTNLVVDNLTNTTQVEQITPEKSNSVNIQSSEEIQTPEVLNIVEVSSGSSKIALKSTSVSTYSDNNVDIEDPVLEFYAEDVRSDQFQEALMDLECYYEF